MSQPEMREINLDRFYHGTLRLGAGDTLRAPGVVARTPAVTTAHVAACLRAAPIDPPSAAESSDAMPGALGLFRADAHDYVLAKAQHNQAGDPQRLFILMPAAALRQLGGNVLAFRSLAMMEMPIFSAVRPNLLPFDLRVPAPPGPEARVDSLLDLLMYCDHSPRSVEGILAGLVQRQPILITGSPASIDLRLRFVQGLLNLLPLPARLGITFVTHVAATDTSPAQLKFASDAAHAEQGDHVVFDWASGKLLTSAPEDAYSRYIVAQLRLDPALVVEQTEQLAQTALWRGMQRDPLHVALAWVSRRAAIDRAVSAGQPADRDQVAEILREDPTLPSDLRQRYVRHLLAFALALDDPTSADVVPVVCVSDRDIAQGVAEQLRTALAQGSHTVYALIERWLLHVPEASMLPWHKLLHAAASDHLSTLVAEGDPVRTTAFLDRLAASPPVLQFREILADLVRSALPAATKDRALARALFLRAVRTLPGEDTCDLLADGPFMAQLPEAVQQAAAYLQAEPRRPAPPGILELGARAFGEEERQPVLARLAECAALRQRPELVSTRALEAVLAASQAVGQDAWPLAIQQIVQELAYAPVILLLEPPGPRVLAQLLLQTHDFDRTVMLLEFYQNEVYGPDGLDEFAQLAGELFAVADVPTDALSAALRALDGSHIRPLPRAAMFAGALHNHRWADDQDFAAHHLTSMLFSDHSLLGHVGHETALDLLAFHARHRNALDGLRVAAALVEYAISLGVSGAPIVAEMWPALTWDDRMTQAALELLRRFVRGMPRAEAAGAVGYLSSSLAAPVEQALRATDLMRAVLDGISLGEFIQQVHVTSALLLDVARVFHSDQPVPPYHRLRRDLDTMTGGISDHERREIAENTLDMGRHLLALGRATRPGHRTEAVALGQAAPQSAVEILMFLGGHFGASSGSPLDLDLEEIGHLFGNRSAAMVHRETVVAARLLGALRRALEVAALPKAPAALAEEIRSLWETLPQEEQRRCATQFGEDCRQLALVIARITQGGSDQVLGDGSLGRRLETGQRVPRTGFEAMRWVSGYFARRHAPLRLR